MYVRTKLLKLNTVWYGRALPAETKHSRWVKPPFGNSKIKRAWTTFLLETISVIYTSRLFVHSGQDLCSMKRRRRGLCVLKIQLGNVKLVRVRYLGHFTCLLMHKAIEIVSWKWFHSPKKMNVWIEWVSDGRRGWVE